MNKQGTDIWCEICVSTVPDTDNFKVSLRNKDIEKYWKHRL